MANANPILPPGSPLQRAQPERNSKLFVTVFAVLTVHVFVLAGMLIQGCKREDRNAGGPQDSIGELTPAHTNPPAASPAEDVARVAPATPTNLPLTSIPTVNTSAPAASLPVQAGTLPEPLPATTVKPPVNDSTLTKVNHPRVKPEGTNQVYTVKAGDTLTRIAKAHGTTVHAIRAVNTFKTDRILVGQKIKLPAPKSGSETGAVLQASPASESPGVAK